MSPHNHTPRLEIIFAASAPVAVILKRGPSKWTHFLRWDLDTDEMTLGSWLRGRVQPEFSALSPDGRLFVYKNLKNNPPNGHDPVLTALSRPPWATALAYWTGWKGTGGGRFESSRQLVVYHKSPIPTDSEPPSWLNVRAEDAFTGNSKIDGIEGHWTTPSGRTVEYQDGTLRASDGSGSMSTVAEFQATTPAPTPSPLWASEWPDPPE